MTASEGQTERDMLVELRTLVSGIGTDVSGIRSDIAALYAARNDQDRRTTTLESKSSAQREDIAELKQDQRAAVSSFREALQTLENKIGAHRRWIVSALVAPVVLIVVGYLLTRQISIP